MKTLSEKIIWIMVALIAAVAIIGTASAIIIARGGYYNGAGNYYPYGMMGGFPYYGMYIIMPIMAVISILAIFLFLYFIMGLFGSNSNMQSDDRAIDILKERYARGEISREEFRKMADELRSR